MSLKSYKVWYAKNKEKRRLYNLEWVKNNPEKKKVQRRKSYYKNRKKNLLKNKKWREKNRVKYLLYLKKYHAEHREEHQKRCKAWRHRNPEKVAAQEKRRYRRKSRREKLQWLKEREYMPVKQLNAVDRIFTQKGVNYA